MPFRVGPMELIILLVIVMMIFGVGRLPQVGSALGRSIKEFRRVQADVQDLTTPGVDSNSEKQNEQEAEKS